MGAILEAGDHNSAYLLHSTYPNLGFSYLFTCWLVISCRLAEHCTKAETLTWLAFECLASRRVSGTINIVERTNM